MHIGDQCISLLAVIIMVLAFPAIYSSDHHIHDRHKRAVVEKSKCKKDVQKNGMTLFNYGIDVLTNGSVNPKGDFLKSLELVFNTLQQNRNATKWKIAEGLERSFRKSRSSLLMNAKDPDKLEFALVRMYTENYIYREMNSALAQHDCTKKELTVEDKDQAAYATALLATLLYWNGVVGYSEPTYRMIGNVKNVKQALKRYELNSNVVFPAFSSSSSDRIASLTFSEQLTDENILLVLDNSQASFWKPKDIMKMSVYPTESEYLYPSLAEFRVLSKPEKKKHPHFPDTYYYEIRLQLDGKKFKETIFKKLRRICKI